MQFSSEALNDLLSLLSGASAVIRPTVIAAALYLLESEREESERATTRIKVNRRRISVLEVYTSMGPRVFRRAFRMTFDSFWHLYSILSTHISTAALEGRNYVPKGGRDGGNYSLPPIPNGEIPSNVRLGAAIRYFAGGSPYDIMCVFGISYSEVLTSVWIVVEAIHKCPQFEISYPEGVEEQREIAAGFEAASTPGIRNCAGAIDGILIWMLKPSLKQAEKSGVDQKKFLCGRKHKFGLNCQAVSDCRGRILDISIKYGGASSDCLAFEASDLHRRLEEGLMKKDGENERFVLFGDNAYLNSPYMATPFTNVSGDPNRVAEDSYNFFHSQLRIRVECAFGMLVQRWGLLRVAMPRNLSVQRIIALVIALAKLHNFCISESNIPERIPHMWVRDRCHIMNMSSGYVGLNNDNPQQTTRVPTELMHLGEHFNDIPRNDLRAQRREIMNNVLPRTVLFNMIVDGHWQRPGARLGNR